MWENCHDYDPAVEAELKPNPKPELDLARLEALREAATAGTWQAEEMQVSSDGGMIGNIVCQPPAEDFVDSFAQWTDNAQFIVAAHNALPALIAEVRRLRDEVGELEDAAEVESETISAEYEKDCSRELRKVATFAGFDPLELATADDLGQFIMREIERLREYDWKPIADAPLDGTGIEVAHAPSGFIRIVSWDSNRDSWWLIGSFDFYAADYFTHFRLLRGPEGV